MAYIEKRGSEIRRSLFNRFLSKSTERPSFTHVGERGRWIDTTSALYRAHANVIKLVPSLFMLVEYDDRPMPLLTGEGDVREEIRQKFSDRDEDEGGWSRETLRKALYSADRIVTLSDLGVEGNNKIVPGLYMPVYKVEDGKATVTRDSDIFPRTYYKWLYRICYEGSLEVDWKLALANSILSLDDAAYKDNGVDVIELLPSALFGAKERTLEILTSSEVPYEGLTDNQIFVKALMVLYYTEGLSAVDKEFVDSVESLVSLIYNDSVGEKSFSAHVLDCLLFSEEDPGIVYYIIEYLLTRVSEDKGVVPAKFSSIYREYMLESSPSYDILPAQRINDYEGLLALYSSVSVSDMEPKDVFDLSERATEDDALSLKLHERVLDELTRKNAASSVLAALRNVVRSLEYRVSALKAGKKVGRKDFVNEDGVIGTFYDSSVGGRKGVLIVDGVTYTKDYQVTRKTPEKVKRMIAYARTGKTQAIDEGLHDYVDKWVGGDWEEPKEETGRRPSLAHLSPTGW